MIKNLILTLFLLIPAAISAQVAVGGWTMYSSFSGVDDIEETFEYVYYRSGGSLFRIDKETMEVSELNRANLLNDSDVTGIFPDKSHKSVIVAYSSGNMDRIYDNGTVVNISDVVDAALSGSRGINDIAFGKDNFYVAADFGLITYSDRKNEVRESLLTPKSVDHVVAMGDIVGIHYDMQMRFAPQSEKIISLDRIPLIGDYTRTVRWLDMEGFGNHSVLLLNKENINGKVTNKLYTLQVDLDNKTVRQAGADAATSTASAIDFGSAVRSTHNSVYASNNEAVFVYSEDEGRAVVSMPRADAPDVAMVFNGNMATVWLGDSEGVRMADYSDPANPRPVHDNVQGSRLTVPQIHAITAAPSGRLILNNRFEHLSFGLSIPSPKRSKVNVLDNGVLTDVSGVDVEFKNSQSVNYSPSAPHFLNNVYNICEDPADPDAYYASTFFEGLYRIKNGKQTHHFYSDNSPLTSIGNGYACVVLQPLVDRNNNLWVYKAGAENSAEDRIFVLPADKRLTESPSKADWKSYSITGHIKDFRDATGLVCNHSDCVIFAMGRYSQELVVFDTKGTPELSDDTQTVLTTYIDQDGKQMDFSHIFSLCEDARGRLWVGTDDGVFEIQDISKATSSTITVNHIKVPRNDGTNLADYLLSSQMVSSISCDSSNRKWISTYGSGAYLVNENGDEILENYNSDNSILPNQVYAVACDPNSNKVYFGTDIGLVEYSSTSSPGSDNYNDVYAYPNPVRPDYTGWITVTGLMSDSLVKIADAAGNVFCQGRSDGGMFVWDGCNQSGERVKTGVYFVFASQNADGSSSCVTKIMVVN